MPLAVWTDNNSVAGILSVIASRFPLTLILSHPGEGT